MPLRRRAAESRALPLRSAAPPGHRSADFRENRGMVSRRTRQPPRRTAHAPVVPVYQAASRRRVGIEPPREGGARGPILVPSQHSCFRRIWLATIRENFGTHLVAKPNCSIEIGAVGRKQRAHPDRHCSSARKPLVAPQIDRVPRSVSGKTLRCCRAAMTKAPRRNGRSPGASVKVPSGRNTSIRPAPAISSALFTSSTPPSGSARSTNNASNCLKNGPAKNCGSSSFLAMKAAPPGLRPREPFRRDSSRDCLR